MSKRKLKNPPERSHLKIYNFEDGEPLRTEQKMYEVRICRYCVPGVYTYIYCSSLRMADLFSCRYFLEYRFQGSLKVEVWEHILDSTCRKLLYKHSNF